MTSKGSQTKGIRITLKYEIEHVSELKRDLILRVKGAYCVTGESICFSYILVRLLAFNNGEAEISTTW